MELNPLLKRIYFTKQHRSFFRINGPNFFFETSIKTGTIHSDGRL